MLILRSQSSRETLSSPNPTSHFPLHTLYRILVVLPLSRITDNVIYFDFLISAETKLNNGIELVLLLLSFNLLILSH